MLSARPASLAVSLAPSPAIEAYKNDVIARCSRKT
jgi:hypothetical protein